MAKLRRKLALVALIALCLSLGVFGGTVSFAAPGDFDISDEASMDAALDRAAESAGQNPESLRQRDAVNDEAEANARARADEMDAALDSQEANAARVNKDQERATLLPVTTKEYSSIEQCKKLMNVVATFDSRTRDYLFQNNGDSFEDSGLTFTQSDVLGCAIKTGSIRLWMVAYYVRYILEFAIQMAGLVAVGGVVYGGYLYLFTGVSDDKEKGKKAIMYSVAGMVLTMVAWAAVNIVIGFLTG